MKRLAGIFSRNNILFVLGITGSVYEIFFTGTPSPEVLIFCAVLVGSPIPSYADALKQRRAETEPIPGKTDAK